jgi:hypothetical protein
LPHLLGVHPVGQALVVELLALDKEFQSPLPFSLHPFNLAFAQFRQPDPAVIHQAPPLQPGQPRLFQSHIVIIVEIVVADDLIAALQPPQRQGRADKARAAGNQDFQKRPSTASAGSRSVTSKV